MNKQEFKKILKKIWWFIWEDNSIWSWIVNIILAFILIKFVVYPIIGLTLATSHPIVAVVSGSMEHDGSFDDWWESTALCDNVNCNQAIYYQGFDITKQDFLEFKFKKGFNKGDIMVLKGSAPEKIKPGDVLVFKSTRPDPIIHRVIKTELKDGTYYFQTKGDHNQASFSSLKEIEISEDRVIGKAIARVPYLGWIKIAAVKVWTIARPR
ncbi:MAG: signal peptidase I [Candidatus Woesearchaeota archaeon]